MYANTQLQHHYYLQHPYVMLSDVVKNPKQDKKLFDIPQDKHTLRVKEKKLLALLKHYGYKNFKHSYSFIQFSLQSPIDTTKLQTALKKLYQQHYKNIQLLSLHIQTRSYTKHMPQNYTIHFKKNTVLRNQGIFSIKSDKKEIFFNYEIRARIFVYATRKRINKNEPLTPENTEKKSIMLQKFQAMPLQTISQGLYQAKHALKIGSIITRRDVTSLIYVHRRDNIQVFFHENGIAITFEAQALQNGKLGDVIYVRHKKGRKIKVKVIGYNMAEVL